MVLNYSRGLAEEFAGWKDLAVSYSVCACVRLYIIGFEQRLKVFENPQIFRNRTLGLFGCRF